MEQTKQELSLIIKKITESFPDENDLKGFLGISKTLIINSLTESNALLSNLNEHDYDKYQGQSKEDIENKIYHSDTPKTKYHKPLLNGESITRYNVHWKGASYIKYGDWLGAAREVRFFTKPRIVVRQIISGNPGRIYAGYTDKELYNTQIAFNILVKENFVKEISPKYILAIINSSVINFYHREKFLDPTKKLFQKILIANAKKLPIVVASRVTQNRIEKLVDSMIILTNKLQKTENRTEARTRLENQISIIDNRINTEILKIYGFSEKDKL